MHVQAMRDGLQPGGGAMSDDDDSVLGGEEDDDDDAGTFVEQNSVGSGGLFSSGNGEETGVSKAATTAVTHTICFCLRSNDENVYVLSPSGRSSRENK